MSPTIHHKYKYFHSTVQRVKDRRKRFRFCHLPLDIRPRNVKFNLSIVRLRSGNTMRRKTYEDEDVIRNKNLPTVFANMFTVNFMFGLLKSNSWRLESISCNRNELNPFTAMGDSIDFTLSNTRRFYSSKGKNLATKGLKTIS